MPRSNEEKKAVEIRALTAARKAGVPIPFGDLPGERPDFRFNEHMLGVDITELLKPASSNFGIMPAEAESYHQEIVQLAQHQYYAAADALPVTINLYSAGAPSFERSTEILPSAMFFPIGIVFASHWPFSIHQASVFRPV